jgi:hypothetical protein
MQMLEDAGIYVMSVELLSRRRKALIVQVGCLVTAKWIDRPSFAFLVYKSIERIHKYHQLFLEGTAALREHVWALLTKQYENVLSYNIGNEVVNLVSNTNAARTSDLLDLMIVLIKIAYVKAAARDIKAYLRGVNSGALVGYAAVDGEPAFRDTLAHYLTCGEEDIVVDLYGEHYNGVFDQS